METMIDKDKLARIWWRKERLKAAGLTYADIDEPALVHRVIHEKEPNKRVGRKIARKLRIRYSEFLRAAA